MSVVIVGGNERMERRYKAYVNARYELIICPAMELVTAEEQEETGPTQTM